MLCTRPGVTFRAVVTSGRVVSSIAVSSFVLTAAFLTSCSAVSVGVVQLHSSFILLLWLGLPNDCGIVLGGGALEQRASKVTWKLHMPLAADVQFATPHDCVQAYDPPYVF